MLSYIGLDVSQQEAAVCSLLGDGREPVPRWTVGDHWYFPGGQNG